MELNLIIEGDRTAAFELASRIERMPMAHAVRSSLAINLEEFSKRADILERLDRKINKPDVVVLFNISSANMLLRAVEVIKQYRNDLAKPVTAIFACDCGVVCLTEYKKKDEFFEPLHIGADFGIADRPSLQEVLNTADAMRDSVSSVKRYPLTWNNKQHAFEAANLEVDGKVICSAVNVYLFESSHAHQLFELAEIVPVSQLHVAVDKMNTHYFKHGSFEKRAYNAQFCRPAQPSEVLEYLNAKYAYMQATAAVSYVNEAGEESAQPTADKSFQLKPKSGGL